MVRRNDGGSTPASFLAFADQRDPEEWSRSVRRGDRGTRAL